MLGIRLFCLLPFQFFLFHFHFLSISKFLNHQQIDPRYEITSDVRGQIKFLEELDKAEQKRHEEVEREILLRAAKSRSKTEDPEQAKLKAKVNF